MPTSSSRPAASTPISIDRQDRLDHGSGRRAARHQAAAARERRREAAPGIDRQLEHLGHPDRGDRRGPLGRFPQALARHALLQPAALPAAARDHPDRRDRSGRRRRHVPFGDHMLGKGVVVAKDTPNFIGNHIGLYGVARTLDVLATGKYTHRRDRRDHRPGARPSRQRDVPDDGHRRHRRAGARDAQPERAAAERRRSRRLRRARRSSSADREGRARREDRQGLLRAAQGRRRRNGDLDARSGDARIPAEAVRAHRVDRSRQVDRRCRRARADAVQRQGQGRRIPARDAGADARLHRARHA